MQRSSWADPRIEGDVAGASVNGSDGTRTRDLRRDRPLRASQRSKPMTQLSLYSWGIAGSSQADSASFKQARSHLCCLSAAEHIRSSRLVATEASFQATPPYHGGPGRGLRAQAGRHDRESRAHQEGSDGAELTREWSLWSGLCSHLVRTV